MLKESNWTWKSEQRNREIEKNRIKMKKPSERQRWNR